MFVGKWQAIQTSGSVLGDAESAAGFGYNSQWQPSCCLSPFLPCSGDSRALLLRAWPKQSKGQVHTGGPCMHSQLRMLRVPAEAMPPAWYGQGSALCLLGAAPGLWLHWTGIFLKEQRCPRVAEHPWNALCLLKHRVHRSDSNVSPPLFCGASPSSQKRKGESNWAYFAQS